MKILHDEQAAQNRSENTKKIWFVKSLELFEKSKLHPKRVIDVGAGKGEFLTILKKKYQLKELYAMDYTVTNLTALKKKGIKIIKQDLENIQLNKLFKYKSAFDLVVCQETIEHVFNLDQLFLLFNYLLNKDGYLLISTPNYASYVSKLFFLLRGYPHAEGHHVRFLTQARLCAYAFFNGFDFQQQNSYFSYGTDLIRRGFGIESNLAIKILTGFFVLPIYALHKFNIFDNINKFGLVVIFKKSLRIPLGFEIENLKEKYRHLSLSEKQNWRSSIRNYRQQDHLSDSVYLKSFLDKIDFA